MSDGLSRRRMCRSGDLGGVEGRWLASLHFHPSSDTVQQSDALWLISLGLATILKASSLHAKLLATSTDFFFLSFLFFSFFFFFFTDFLSVQIWGK